eukprot:361935-Chlamydomonas_euryale.AAC.3
MGDLEARIDAIYRRHTLSAMHSVLLEALGFRNDAGDFYKVPGNSSELWRQLVRNVVRKALEMLEQKVRTPYSCPCPEAYAGELDSLDADAAADLATATNAGTDVAAAAEQHGAIWARAVSRSADLGGAESESGTASSNSEGCGHKNDVGAEQSVAESEATDSTPEVAGDEDDARWAAAGIHRYACTEELNPYPNHKGQCKCSPMYNSLLRCMG